MSGTLEVEGLVNGTEVVDRITLVNCRWEASGFPYGSLRNGIGVDFDLSD